MLAIIFVAGAVIAAPSDFQSNAGQVTLLELYTSEGCSSCPPAEEWLSKLKDSPELWKSIVPVAFHVDYWDYLGWRDTWASKAFTNRQQAYAKTWGTGEIYTPEFVRNGKEWRAGGLPERSTAKPGTLHALSQDGREWKISFTAEEKLSGDFEIHVALLGNAMRSNVRAGENRGRQLLHDFAALALVDAPLQNREGTREAIVKFPGAPPKDSGKLAVAIWVTRAGEITPVQASGGWLAE